MTSTIKDRNEPLLDSDIEICEFKATKMEDEDYSIMIIKLRNIITSQFVNITKHNLH